MKGHSSVRKAGAFFILAIMQMLVGLPLTTSLAPPSVSGALAMSGSFYAQKFEIPVGGTVRGSSVYVTAFNNGADPVTFVMGYAAPPKVTLDFSDNAFVLNGGQSREVMVEVHVGSDAVPGTYEIAVNLRAQRDTAEGIQVLGAAEQVAPLSIVEESGKVHVESVSPHGDSVKAHVRLWKVINGNEYEYFESHTGVLDAVVSPGSYVVKAFSGGEEFASRRFSVAGSEQKSISMTVETVYFKSFYVLLNDEGTEEASAQLVYTIANAFRPVAEVSVDLVVMLDGIHLETIPSIAAAGMLDVGEMEKSFTYTPNAGWEEGVYSYRLELYVGGELHASSRSVRPGERDASHGDWLWMVWVAVGIVGIAGLGSLAFIAWKSRRALRG